MVLKPKIITYATKIQAECILTKERAGGMRRFLMAIDRSFTSDDRCLGVVQN